MFYKVKSPMGMLKSLEIACLKKWSPFDDPFFQFWDRFYTKKILRKMKKLFVDNREDAVKPNFHAVTFDGHDIAVLLEVPCIITEHNLTQQTITVR